MYSNTENSMRGILQIRCILICVLVIGVVCYLFPAMYLQDMTTQPNDVENYVENVEIVTEPAYRTDIPYYTVNGKFLGHELSSHLYEQLESYRMEWFYEVALCQLYQESRFEADIVSPDGGDLGIAQLRNTYFEYFTAISGLVEADPFNPYDSIHIYVHLMCSNIKAVDGDIHKALSKYNVGNFNWYNENYVNAVLQWYDTLEVVE